MGVVLFRPRCIISSCLLNNPVLSPFPLPIAAATSPPWLGCLTRGGHLTSNPGRTYLGRPEHQKPQGRLDSYIGCANGNNNINTSSLSPTGSEVLAGDYGDYENDYYR